MRYKNGWSTWNLIGSGGLENEDMGTATRPAEITKHISLPPTCVK